MRQLLVLAAGLAALLGACANEETVQSSAADIVVYEAQSIVTMDSDLPRARYVATSNGRILAVAASIEEISRTLDGAAFTFDRQFAGKVLMPGLIDPHLHPMMAFLLPMHFITPEGWALPSGVSAPSRSPEDYHARLSSALAADDASTPFFTWGYHQLWHGPMDRAALDAIAPTRPVIVWHRSFHGVILNSAALKLFGLDTREAYDLAMSAAGADPEHGNFDQGHFFESGLGAALPPMRPYILSPMRLNAGFDAMKQMMLENGVTTIADMATGLFAGFETERALIDAAFGELSENPARVMLVPDANSAIRETGSLDAAVEYVTTLTSEKDARIFVNNRIKLFADGAFFSQYMQMGPPGYDDGHQGKWINPPEEFETYARAFWNAGVTIHWHVNGDAGLDAVLDVVEKLQLETPRDDHRLTLEHLGYSREDQNTRIAALGVLVSAQPNYVYVLSDKYAERGLGYERASQISRLGSLEDKNVTLALHSDLTMAPVDPLSSPGSPPIARPWKARSWPPKSVCRWTRRCAPSPSMQLLSWASRKKSVRSRWANGRISPSLTKTLIKWARTRLRTSAFGALFLKAGRIPRIEQAILGDGQEFAICCADKKYEQAASIPQPARIAGFKWWNHENH